LEGSEIDSTGLGSIDNSVRLWSWPSGLLKMWGTTGANEEPLSIHYRTPCFMT